MSESDDQIPSPPARAVRPAGINHIVLNVRDIEESHQFWTEILGFTQVGEYEQASKRDPNRRAMRFYSGDHSGRMNHHDIALVEVAVLAGGDKEQKSALNHVAITFPDRETWLQQLAWVQSQGVKFDRRVNHGVTHSLYIRDPNGHGVELLYELPREVWEGDINAALNYAQTLPTEGQEALVDDVESSPVFAPA
jgi:catechol 2,3-dioxygenase